MVLTPITAARVTVACLAASLGLGSFWTKVQTPSEQPVSRATDGTGRGTLHNDASLVTERVQIASGLGEKFVEDAPPSTKTNLSMAQVDGIPTTEVLPTSATPIESVADVVSQNRPDLQTIEPAQVNNQSDTPNPLVDPPVTEADGFSWEAAVRDFSRDSSPMAWAIVASFPLDCLLMFFLFGLRRFSCCGKRAGQRAALDGMDDRSLTNGEEPEVSDEVVRDLAGELKGCSEVSEHIDVRAASSAIDVDQAFAEEGDAPPMPSPQQGDPQPSVEQKPTRRSPKSAGELKEWMEKQREQCDIVENSQAFVATDAKATNSEAHADEALPLDLAPQSLRNKRRSGAELKALMEKKREECQVLESSQEHVDTDAKAGGFASKSYGRKDDGTHNAGVDSNLAAAPARRCNTSSKDAKDWMARLRNRCEVIEGPAPVLVETDAKSSARPVKSPKNKENIANVEEASITTDNKSCVDRDLHDWMSAKKEQRELDARFSKKMAPVN